MTHWRHMMDDTYLHAADLRDQERVVVIEKITQGTFPDFEDPKAKKRKPVIWFKGKKKPLGLNSTNARQIAKLLGSPVVEQWIGKAIIIYPTTTRAFGEEWECIRVKNRLPSAQQTAAAAKSNEQLDASAEPDAPLSAEERRAIELAEREEAGR